jgi:3-oxoacyl-[acyl-carrier protein] reductase
MYLKGKVTLVTGGSRGLGAGIAVALHRQGAQVAVNYVQGAAQAEEVCGRIKSEGGRALAIQADVSVGADVRAMVKKVEASLGPIDILVNNAGHNPLHSIDRMSEKDWEEVISLNLKSYFLVSKAVLEGMVKRKAGRIINITSIAGQRGGLACDVDYSAAKAGIMGFTRSLARWAAPQGILVNAIAPGYIATDNLFAVCSKERIKQIIASIPLGRLGTPEDIGGVVAFLAGPGGAYMVGEVLTVNGGAHIA